MKRFFNAHSISIIAIAASLISVAHWGTTTAKRQFDQSIAHDMVAASRLAKMQIHGEMLRRFEKETFIYIGVPAKREGYVKEHDAAYGELLQDLDAALAPSGKAFTDEERKEIVQWKEAALFYDMEFTSLARKAARFDLDVMTPADAGRLTVEFNGQITEGKNRFRLLLNGANALRLKKEAQSQAVKTEIDRTFDVFVWVNFCLAGLACLALPLLLRLRTSAAGIPAGGRQGPVGRYALASR
jgi:hypothetical protein